MKAGQRPEVFFRTDEGEVAYGQRGDEVRIFGFPGFGGLTPFWLPALTHPCQSHRYLAHIPP
jgi:hypothetical protein